MYTEPFFDSSSMKFSTVLRPVSDARRPLSVVQSARFPLRLGLLAGMIGIGAFHSSPVLAQTTGVQGAALAPSDPASAPVSGASPSIASAAVQARRAARRPKIADYLEAAAGLAFVLSAARHPAYSPLKAFEGDQQFSVISPFPGGGFSVLANGDLRPGGAMQVNIPLAYTPERLTGILSIDAAQLRQGRNFLTASGRNGTANVGVGFSAANRGVWVSRMLLSQASLRGGDAVFCALVQLAPETQSVPAIALGIQDATNERIRSPFIVATKQLGQKPVFATFGLGRGRFSGSDVFGGVSYAPIKRVTLSGEYDGLQLNVGAGYAVTPKLSLLASLDDLANAARRPAARQGRRYQVGANLVF